MRQRKTKSGGRHALSVRARDDKIQKTAAEPIGVDFNAPNELTLSISSKSDPRLVALVRILARQAARDFIRRRRSVSLSRVARGHGQMKGTKSLRSSRSLSLSPTYASACAARPAPHSGNS
jgi:hypothetical protein